jgi:hypothetical protein
MGGRIGLTALLALAVAISPGQAGDRVFGAGVSTPDTLLVSALLATPDAFVGDTVRVEGLAVAVCEHRGCWVDIASDVEGEVVRVKVPDGEIVFPPEILGQRITAEGTWTANQLDLETTRMVCEREARSEGKDLDPASVTECRTLYQISGTGAVVHGEAAGDTPRDTPGDGA